MFTGLKTTRALVHAIAALVLCTTMVSCKDDPSPEADFPVSETIAPVAEPGPVLETTVPVAESDPVRAFQAYCQALREGDIETADSLIARSPKLPEKHITNFNTVFSRQSDTYFRFVIHPELFFVKGDCAAVLCDIGREGKAWPARALLIRQEGQWRVLMKCWERDLSWYPFGDQLQKDRTAVEAWADARLAGKAQP